MYRFFEQDEFTTELARNLDFYESEAGKAWGFSKVAKRSAQHGLIQYPAMMVPSMQKCLLESVDRIQPGSKRLLDPFMGSGTMLTEAMQGGHSFIGRDINPLAILACQVKSTNYERDFLERKAENLLERLRADSGRSFETKFKNYQKWFSRAAIIKLSRIKRAIQKESDLPTRRFFWLILAETVRLNSNSRTTTYKLHIRPEIELAQDKRDAIKTFEQKLKAALNAIFNQEVFSDRPVSTAEKLDSSIKRNIDIKWGDSAQPSTLSEIDAVDLVFTSPPYGDNLTTVPYGQFSYLPLQWIPSSDICYSIPDDLLSSTLAIDSSSLGGSKRKAREKAERVAGRSSSFLEVFDRLMRLEGDYAKRVAVFSFDLVASFDSFSDKLRHDGLMFVTIGNRSVGGEIIPLDKILAESLEDRHVIQLGEIEREIPRKRMPNRNSISSTMNKEKVLIFRKV